MSAECKQRTILGLESSAKSASACLMRGGVILARAFQNSGLTHSRTLLPMVQSLLDNSEKSMDDIDVIAAAVGPGSFTGLRIGVSAAAGLAWARNLPCAAVSTLEAMARNVAHLEDTLIICAMDARRAQIYNAVFLAQGGTPVRLCADRAISIAETAEEWRHDPRPKIIVGDGALLCYNGFHDMGVDCRLAPQPLRMQDAVGVCQCAEAMDGAFLTAAQLHPVYLRLSQAERERQNAKK